MAEENDYSLGVGIEFKVRNLDEFKGELQSVAAQFGQDFTSLIGGQTTRSFEKASAEHRKYTTTVTGEVKKQVDAHAAANKQIDELNKQRLTGFRTVSDLELQYAKAKTSEIIKEADRLLTEKKKYHQDALMAETKAAADSAKIREKQLAEELKGLYDLSRKRSEVMNRGAGALIGQLGIGREVMQGIFAGPMGGSAMKFMDLGSKTKEIADAGQAFSGMAKGAAVAGVAVLAVTESVKLASEAFHSIEERARKYEEGEDRLAIALSRTGLSIQDQRKELQYVGKDADELSKTFVKPREEIANTMGTIMAFGRVGGQNLKHLTELTIGISESTGMATEKVAKFIGKGTDPEIEASLQRLGVNIGKNATQQERIIALDKAYGATIEATKERMQEGVHSYDQMKNAVDLVIGRFSNQIFREIGPLFQKMEGPAEKFATFMGTVAVYEIEKGVHTIKALYNGVKEAYEFIDSHLRTAEGRKEKSQRQQILAEEQNRQEAARKRIDEEERARTESRMKEFKYAGDKNKTLEQINQEWFTKQRGQYDVALADRLNKIRIAANAGVETEEQAHRDELAANIQYNEQLSTLTSKRKGLEKDYLEERRNIARDESEILKSLREERTKNQKSTYDQIISMHEISAKREINLYEEEGHTEREIKQKSYETNRDFLRLELEEAQTSYGERSEQARVILQKIEDNEHQHNMQVLADTKQQKTNLLTITRQIEDSRANAIVDRTDRETKIEELRHKRKIEDIKRDIEDEKQRDAALELERLTHEDAVVKIQNDSLQKQRDFAKGILNDVLQPIDNGLSKLTKDWGILGNVANKVLNSIEGKGADVISNALFPGSKRGAGGKGGDLGSSLASSLFGSFLSTSGASIASTLFKKKEPGPSYAGPENFKDNFAGFPDEDKDLPQFDDGDPATAGGKKVLRGNYRKVWLSLHDIAIDRRKIPGLGDSSGSTAYSLDSAVKRGGEIDSAQTALRQAQLDHANAHIARLRSETSEIERPSAIGKNNELRESTGRMSHWMGYTPFAGVEAFVNKINTEADIRNRHAAGITGGKGLENLYKESGENDVTMMADVATMGLNKIPLVHNTLGKIVEATVEKFHPHLESLVSPLAKSVAKAVPAIERFVEKDAIKIGVRSIAETGVDHGLHAVMHESVKKGTGAEYRRLNDRGDYSQYGTSDSSGDLLSDSVSLSSRKEVPGEAASRAALENTRALIDSARSTRELAGVNTKLLSGNTSKAAGLGGMGLGLLAKLTGEAAGGPLGLIGGILGSLAGFDNEGDFPVGGARGVDRNLVAFRASHDERVRIYRPGSSNDPATRSRIVSVNEPAPAYMSSGGSSSSSSGPMRLHPEDIRAIVEGMKGVQVYSTVKDIHEGGIRGAGRASQLVIS